jgi:hypothetical protein
MTNKTSFVFGSVVLLLIGFVLGVLGLNGTHEQAPVQTDQVEEGNVAGVQYEQQTFGGDVRQGPLGALVFRNGAMVGPIGGGVFATRTPSNSTATADMFDLESVIDMTLTTTSGTLTFPATSTLPKTFLPRAGDTKTLWVRNATTTASVNLTVAAGTGMVFKNSASSSAIVIGDTDGSNMIRMIMQRKANGDIMVFLTRFFD